MTRKWWILSLLMVLNSQTAFAAVKTMAVEYRHGDAVLEGYLAYDDAVTEKRPGVLVVHEWKGLNDYAKSRAEMLAELGYVAFAADMYGKGILAADHEEAARLSGIYRNDRNLMRARALAALEVLKSRPEVDVEKLAAIGYCFGGTTVLELARAGENLKGVVSFHGSLSAPLPAQSGQVKARVLVMHGGLDSFISKDEVAGFQSEMEQAGADWHFVTFGKAVHSFTVPSAGNDPSKGMAYNPDADRRSWKYMQDFFDEIFQG